jgi:hypothetical protein
MTRSSIRTLRRSAPVAAGPAAAAGTALHAVPGPSPAGSSGSELVSVGAANSADAWPAGLANASTSRPGGAITVGSFAASRDLFTPATGVAALLSQDRLHAGGSGVTRAIPLHVPGRSRAALLAHLLKGIL